MRSVKSHDRPRVALRRREQPQRQQGESQASEETAATDGLLDIADVRMLLREIRLRDARRKPQEH